MENKTGKTDAMLLKLAAAWLDNPSYKLMFGSERASSPRTINGAIFVEQLDQFSEEDFLTSVK